MIESISLSGFQSHKNSNLDFSNGVNVIVGKSDCGKSAIIRALRLVLENKPSGDSFINHDCKDMTVSMKINDTDITRGKGSENTYTAGKEKFTAFGQSVPEPIVAVTKFHDVNAQFQLDSPFLLSMTPGEAGQYLNSIMNLDIIDQTVKAAQAMARENKAAISALTATIATLESEEAGYVWLTDAEAALEKLQALEGKHNELTGEKQKIEDTILSIESVVFLPVPDISKQLATLAKIETEYSNAISDAEAVKNAIISVESIDLTQIPDISKQLAVLAKAEADLDAAEELASQIRCAIDDVSEYGHKVDGLASELSQVKKELDKIKVCSACGRPL